MLVTQMIESPEKNFVTPALTAAQKKAKKFLKDALRFGDVATGPHVAKLLRREHHSVSKCFSWVVTMAFSKPTSYRRPNGRGGFESVIVNRPGGRRWAQRDLACVANMSVNTCVRALKRLRALGLIRWKAWVQTGTYIFVKNFSKYVNPKSFRAALNPAPSASQNRVSMADTLRSPPAHNLPIQTSDLRTKHLAEGGASQNARMSARDRAELARLFPEVPAWAL